MTVDSAWFVYMVRTADGYLYTGVTTNVQRRFAEHQAAAGQTVIVESKTESQARPIARSKGAKYFRGKRGLQLVFEKTVADRSTAQKLEYKIKRLGKRDKEALAAGKLSITNLVAEIND